MLKLDFSALKSIIDGMRELEGSFFAARNGGVLLKTIALANQKGGVAISHRTGFATAARPVWYADK